MIERRVRTHAKSGLLSASDNNRGCMRDELQSKRVNGSSLRQATTLSPSIWKSAVADIVVDPGSRLRGGMSANRPNAS